MTATFDADEVKQALRPTQVLEHYGVPHKRAGDQFESRVCPRRPDHDRRALVISRSTGLWWCHPCNYGGDLLHLVAELEHLEIVRDFPAVLVKAAEIAGVAPVDLPAEERARRRDDMRRRQLAEEAADASARAQRDHRAIAIATAHWSQLPRQHRDGCAYLAARGVRDALRYEIVRFEHDGSPAIPLHTSDGKIRNVVCRRLAGEPKVLGLQRCPTPGTMVNAVSDIVPSRAVVLVEGVFDSITATLAWPHDIVLGAHGAGNLAKIATVAAKRCAAVGARLMIVPHNDAAGEKESRKAARIAVESGLSLRDSTLAIVHTGAKDLNEAWNAGWRAVA